VNNHQDFDDELVRWTDQLLAGNAAARPEGLDELAEVVRQLKQTIAPENPPSPAFRANLQNVLLREWSHRPKEKYRAFVWSHNRTLNLTLLAACLAGALLIVALLIEQAENGEKAAQGTSVGSLPWVFGASAVVVVVVGIGMWFFKGRGKS